MVVFGIVLLVAQAAAPSSCISDEVKCTGKYKGDLKKVRQYGREPSVSAWAYLPAEASSYEKIVYTISETQ
jgi:hypothetical protein